MASNKQERGIIVHRQLEPKELQVVIMQQTAIACLANKDLVQFGKTILENPNGFLDLLNVADCIPDPVTLKRVLMEENADEMSKAQEYFPAILKFFEDDCCGDHLEKLIVYHPDFVTYVHQIVRDLGEQADQFGRAHIVMAALLRVDKKPLIYPGETRSAYSFLTHLWNYLDGKAELPQDRTGLKKDVLINPNRKDFKPKSGEEASLKQLSSDLLYRVRILEAFDEIHQPEAPEHKGVAKQRDFSKRISQINLLKLGTSALQRCLRDSTYLTAVEVKRCQETIVNFQTSTAAAIRMLRETFPGRWGEINDLFGRDGVKHPVALTFDEAIGVDLMDPAERLHLGQD